MKLLLILLAVFGLPGTASPSAQATETKPDQPSKWERMGKVHVLGEVRTPQVMFCAPGLTIAQAIGNCGGGGEFGATPIYLLRGKKLVFKTTMKMAIRSPATDDWMLEPEDILFVGSDLPTSAKLDELTAKQIGAAGH